MRRGVIYFSGTLLCFANWSDHQRKADCPCSNSRNLAVKLRTLWGRSSSTEMVIDGKQRESPRLDVPFSEAPFEGAKNFGHGDT